MDGPNPIHNLNIIFLCIWDGKYSIGWGPPIGVCRSEMELQKPNFTNFDAFFLQKVHFQMESGKGFFLRTSFQLFGGSGRPFFRRLRHFSREVVTLFQRGGSSASRTTSLEIWTARQMIIIYAQPIRNAVQHFSREVVPVPAEPPPWKSGQPGTPYEKKTTALSGGKTKKKLPKFFFI